MLTRTNAADPKDPTSYEYNLERIELGFTPWQASKSARVGELHPEVHYIRSFSPSATKEWVATFIAATQDEVASNWSWWKAADSNTDGWYASTWLRSPNTGRLSCASYLLVPC
jgi:hypothetical protein